MKQLSHLDMSKNKLEGSLPNELYNALSLQNIFLYSNRLSGTISTRIVNLWDLEYFNLSSNQLSGPIPNTMRSGGRGIYKIRMY